MPTELTEALIDRAYEAALVPGLWGMVFDDLACLTESAFGSLALMGDHRFRSAGSPVADQIVSEFNAWGRPEANSRIGRGGQARYHAFLTDYDIFEPQELENDPFYVEFLRPRGYGWFAGTLVDSTSGDVIIMSVERKFTRGPFEAEHVRRLNSVRPHLARACLLSSRLALERVTAATEALDRVGIAAAAIGFSGRVLSMNPQLQGAIPAIVAPLRARLTFADPNADKVFLESVSALNRRGVHGAGRSFPIRSRADAPASIVHIIPLRGSTRDIFSQAAALVLVIPVTARAAPSLTLLQGLFDLTPAEARVAQAIAKGESIAQFARSALISHETARTQVKSILGKTGLSRQSALTALLSGLGTPSG